MKDLKKLRNRVATPESVFDKDYSIGNVSNIIRAEDERDYLLKVHAEGEKDGESVHMGEIAHKHLRWRDGYVYCFSGYPGSGKSEFLNYLSLLQAKKADRKIAMYSPENYPIGKLIVNLVRSYLGKNVSRYYSNICTQEELEEGLEFVNDHYYFLRYEDIPRLDDILNTYQILHDEQDVSMFITDPFNATAEGAHMGDSSNISKYLKIALTQMKIFASKNKVVNCIVEHPKTPMVKGDGGLPEASPWTLYGGTMWWNKMDGIVILSRDLASNDSRVDVKVWKSKDHRLDGQPGLFEVVYDITTGRYLNQVI